MVAVRIVGRVIGITNNRGSAILRHVSSLRRHTRREVITVDNWGNIV